MVNVYKVCFEMTDGCTISHGAADAIDLAEKLELPLDCVSFMHDGARYWWELNNDKDDAPVSVLAIPDAAMLLKLEQFKTIYLERMTNNAYTAISVNHSGVILADFIRSFGDELQRMGGK
jgi:hypothetical protein